MAEQSINKPITDDGSLAALRLPRPEGRKNFHCEKITQSALVNRTFWVVDFDKDVKTKFGEGKYVVCIKFDLSDSESQAKKFFTGSSEIKQVLEMIKERKAFPRKVTLRMEGQNYWME